MAKVTIDNLQKEIDKILSNYKDEVDEHMDEIVVRVGKKGAQALRNESKSKLGGTGKYAKGWTATAEKNRLYTKIIIHNSKQPGLAHLLEFGHALIVGGRRLPDVPAHTHIEPVEKEIVADFEREVTTKL